VEKPKGIGGIWRKLLTVAKWAIGVLIALALLFIGINWFDEDLSPEAKALLAAPQNPYRPEENLYLALLGFDAPKGESTVAAGEARVTAYEKEIALALTDPPRGPNEFPDSAWDRRTKLEFQGKAEFCQPLGKSCLTGVEIHAAEIDRLIKANRELYNRYSSLRNLKGFYETATPSVYSILTGYVPRPVRQLYLANVAMRVRSGVRSQQKTAIADLGDDIRTWRRELTGGSLIPKMVAVAYLQGDYALLSDIIADGSLDIDASSPVIRPVLELPEDDWKIGNVFPFEFRFAAYVWSQVRVATGKSSVWDFSSEEGGWWVRFYERIASPFFKINATQNLDARVKAQLRKMADDDPKNFFAARDAYRNWLRDNVEFGTHYAYNPTGKLLLNIGSNALEGYPLRSYDGAAFQRLVRLGYEIRRQRITDRAIPTFMQQHPEWSSHPVDGRLFIWDENKREIAVQTLGQQPQGRRFSIPIWSQSPRK